MKWITGLVLVCAAVAAGYALGARHPHVPEPQKKSSNVTPLIATGTVERRTFAEVVPLSGKVVANAAVNIMPLELGQVISQDVEDERPVEAGTELFTLGGPDVERRQADLEKQAASLRSQEALAEKVVTLKQAAVHEHLAKEDELVLARQDVARLQGEVAAAESALETYRNRLHVRSPIAGTFTKRVVSAGQNVQAGEVLAQVVTPHQVTVIATAFAPEDTSPQGMTVNLDLPNGGVFATQVSRVPPQRTDSGGTELWMEDPRLPDHFAPGDTVTGTLVLAQHADAAAIPESAVVYDEDGKAFVFVPSGDTYRKQPVTLGLQNNGWVEVLSGLEEHDAVVVEGAYELFYADFGSTYKVPD